MSVVTAPSARGAALLVLAAVLLAYANALGGPFQFDDWWAVADNPAIHDLGSWWRSLPGIRPLLKLSYALNWQLAPAPWSFHAVNIAIHAGNALLLLAIARRCLPALAPQSPAPGLAALAWALLLALHPAATEAVTYISGRSIGLSTLCYLAAILAHLHGDDGDRRARALTLAGFALALAVRETAATLPLALLLLDRCRGRSWRQALQAQRWLWGLLALALLAAALTPGYRSFLAWSLQTREPGEQLLAQLVAHRYLVTGPLLGRLNIDPDLRLPAGLEPGLLVLPTALLVLAALAWRRRRQQPWIGFALAWYLLHLLPSHSLLPRFDLGNDRHLYLALPGALLPLALAVAQLRPPRLAATTLLLLALALAGRTWQRNADYRSELALWQATVAASPHKPRPWVNLGWARQLAGDRQGAITAYRCALTFDPNHPQARLNLVALGQQPTALPCSACEARETASDRP